MGDVWIVWTVTDFAPPILPELFEFGVGVAADARGIIPKADTLRALVAVFLEGFELRGDAGEGGDAKIVGLWIGRKEFGGSRREEELRKVGGGSLEANFGKFAAIMAADEVDEVILMVVKLDGMFLSEAPFAVAAVGFPIGNVALRNVDADFFKCLGDFFLWDVVKEHAVNDVSDGFWKAGDLAVAGHAGPRRMIG